MSINETHITKLSARHTWTDLHAEPSVISRLKSVAEGIKADKGGIVLFTGSSSIGKTLAAQILTSELGLDLYRVDLAAVINKYIGETEKNLNQLFEQAEKANAVLLFDEADALFGKRTDVKSVKDAHDRSANLETGYLLNRMEQYTGLVILTSNLNSNFDDAFMQRVQWTVDFPPPRPKPRLSIWRRLLKWFGL